MNERLKELAEQAGFHITLYPADTGWVWCSDAYPIDEELERFAELVRQDEREAINGDHRIAQAAGAKKGKKGYWEFDEHELKKFIELSRESEREACAALVEADGRVHPKAPDFVWAKTVAKLIRARGEPNPAFKNLIDDKWAGIL